MALLRAPRALRGDPSRSARGARSDPRLRRRLRQRARDADASALRNLSVAGRSDGSVPAAPSVTVARAAVAVSSERSPMNARSLLLCFFLGAAAAAASESRPGLVSFRRIAIPEDV